MRLSGGAARAPESRGGKPSGAADAGRRARFGEALRSATRGAADELAPGAAPPVRAAVARRAAAGGEDALLSERRRGFGEDERRAALPPPAAAGKLGTAEVSAAAPPELRALVRTLPVAVDAARLREGAPLSLSFGRSLDVELRPAAGGLELVLRPEARLTRACEAELPRVVAALAARGVTVARAQVRARAPVDGGGPRVDLPPPLR